MALAKEAGFDVSKADMEEYQANQALEQSDEELEGIAGGVENYCYPYQKPTTA